MNNFEKLVRIVNSLTVTQKLALSALTAVLGVAALALGVKANSPVLATVGFLMAADGLVAAIITINNNR